MVMRRVLACAAVVAVAALVGWVCYQRGYRSAERHSNAELDRVVLRELVRDVEVVRDRLGRVPADQDELELLLSRPLPSVYDPDSGLRSPVQYLRNGPNSFQLQYELLATDDWIFDSERPEAGWVQRFY